MFCVCAGHFDEFYFRCKRIEKRRFNYARNLYHNEFIDFPPRTYSRVPSHFFYESNHRSYDFGSQKNNFVIRRFSYDPSSHRGDCFPRRHGFPARGSYTRFEPKHLDGPHFPHRGSRPTGSNGKVQKTMKTSSCRMVKS
jgi:hypothetical protein